MQYSKPPIIEAAIAITFSESVELKELQRLQAKLNKTYPSGQTRLGRAVTVVNGRPDSLGDDHISGFRMADEHEHNIAQISLNEVAFSMMAPYEGWADFRNRAKALSDTAKEVYGYRKIARLGVRYVNRIDVPIAGRTGFETLEYLTVAPFAPRTDLLNTTLNFVVRFESPVPGGFLAIVHAGSGIMPPAILDHAPLVLDIDIIRQIDVPQKHEDVWAMIDEMRQKKNDVFEMCITDKTRELFAQ